MVQSASLFNQLLQHFPRTEFASLVKKHQAERAAKGFACWTQFVAMTFCQLAHADSLREICNGLACSEGKLVHLGIANAPNKSTLSYAVSGGGEGSHFGGPAGTTPPMFGGGDWTPAAVELVSKREDTDRPAVGKRTGSGKEISGKADNRAAAGGEKRTPERRVRRDPIFAIELWIAY